jgi:hypothetical protein
MKKGNHSHKNIKEKQYLNADKRTSFDKFLDDVKDSVFSVLFVLLKEDTGGILYFAMENLIDYIQMHEFIFNEQINSVRIILFPSTEKTDYFCGITKILHLQNKIYIFKNEKLGLESG